MCIRDRRQVGGYEIFEVSSTTEKISAKDLEMPGSTLKEENGGDADGKKVSEPEKSARNWIIWVAVLAVIVVVVGGGFVLYRIQIQKKKILEETPAPQKRQVVHEEETTNRGVELRSR
eukprot:TRINITY_DN25995_c0_g2_i2.p2 TRINITY_DN25995_c0_g2~~TRINITY_DN25995_c0_g2_i2.p2  ORF type:complete len:118 (-),score=26.73 TRINITY_DN25995_c0_g2_i2:176-529(-)